MEQKLSASLTVSMSKLLIQIDACVHMCELLQGAVPKSRNSVTSVGFQGKFQPGEGFISVYPIQYQVYLDRREVKCD